MVSAAILPNVTAQLMPFPPSLFFPCRLPTTWPQAYKFLMGFSLTSKTRAWGSIVKPPSVVCTLKDTFTAQ